MINMTLTPQDLQAIGTLFETIFDVKFEQKFEEKFDAKFEQKFKPVQDELSAMNYKIDSHFDILNDKIDALAESTGRIERAQRSEIKRVDRNGAAIARLNRELGLA